MYQWLRTGLFALPPETAHELALNALRAGRLLGLGRMLSGCPPSSSVSVFGLDFANPVGLAAGMDKNGDYIDALGELGFGFIEVGTITPRAQPGNPKPRLFRLQHEQALINRLGFNNKGVDHLVKQLARRRWKGVVGVNIGKQMTTPIRDAPADYRYCLERVYPSADYITINVSSPNTENLRSLQDADALAELLRELADSRGRLEREHGCYRPLLVKIAPDWEEPDLVASLEVIASSGMDGVIATNTTTSREGLEHGPVANEAGGLSGAPLKRRADRVLEICRRVLGGGTPLVGLGGITRPEDAVDKFARGAALIQIYTGFIYHGPALVHACVRALARG